MSYLKNYFMPFKIALSKFIRNLKIRGMRKQGWLKFGEGPKMQLILSYEIIRYSEKRELIRSPMEKK